VTALSVCFRRRRGNGQNASLELDKERGTISAGSAQTMSVGGLFEPSFPRRACHWSEKQYHDNLVETSAFR